MYIIPYAQPAQDERPYVIKGKSEMFSDGIYVIGDHRGGATLNGAMSSGKRAAENILMSRKTAIVKQSATVPTSTGVLLKDVPIRE